MDMNLQKLHPLGTDLILCITPVFKYQMLQRNQTFQSQQDRIVKKFICFKIIAIYDHNVVLSSLETTSISASIPATPK